VVTEDQVEISHQDIISNLSYIKSCKQANQTPMLCLKPHTEKSQDTLLRISGFGYGNIPRRATKAAMKNVNFLPFH
jgi:hypothetical protein